MSDKKYDPSKVEKKWQEKWEKDKIFSPDLEKAGTSATLSTRKPAKGEARQGRPFYNLMMFPYPSAEGLHVGNMYAFTGADIYGRFQRMQGYDVFEPIGLDGFGIHSENYAFKVGKHPREQSEISEKNFYKQLHRMGNSFDWTRTVETYDPNYYKWTQWLFVQLFKNGLAYRKKASVNWCPSDNTVLADEQVIDGKCERDGVAVEKKDLEQWFFRITKYADRLLKNIDGLDWSEKVKIAQKNWIGKSEGAKVAFRVQGLGFSYELEVFTTRPDTLYGATFMVVSPEHKLVAELLAESSSKYQVSREIKNYVEKAKKRSDQDRIAQEGKKTGVFSGLYAINPVNNKKIPVWIADYVLASYGTGAIMAVPAHDQRDFEFAKKYDLPIKQVVIPISFDNLNPPQSKFKDVRRDMVIVHLRDKSTGRYALLNWHESLEGISTGIMGGIEEDETAEEAALREIMEEAAIKDAKIVAKSSVITGSRYCASHKNENRIAITVVVLAEVENLSNQGTIAKKEQKLHTLVWIDEKEVQNHLTPDHQKLVWSLLNQEKSVSGEGEIVNSDEYDGMDSLEMRKKIVDDLEKQGLSKRESNYHLRDWLISRQRYWGPPIPMIYCSNCAEKDDGEQKEMPGWYTEKEENLPVILPDVKDWKPRGTGKSPLANNKDFFEVKCPECGGDAKRETDVSDTFLDSSWYFFRYLGTEFEDVPFPSPKFRNSKLEINSSAQRTAKWLPVDMYIGGSEHAVLHLLYSRFMTMALKDLGYIDFEEPFSKFFAHGLIIKDGAKMSKSKGNVVVPDEYIDKYGVDTMRMYLMFIGPFEDGGEFSDPGIEGMNRFIKRIWRLLNAVEVTDEEDSEVKKSLHKTIKVVTEDIQQLSYNTAIAHLMEFYNAVSKRETLAKETVIDFLKLISPFTPHMAEELYQSLKDQSPKIKNQGARVFDSIHLSKWPEFDPKLVEEDEVTIVIQVNGKHRGEIRIKNGELKIRNEVEEKARNKVSKYIEDHKVKKIIYIEGKIINFVI